MDEIPKWILIVCTILISSPLCAAEPPFSNLTEKPSIHPYTFINPGSNPLDYQQMKYLRDKYENQQKPKHYQPSQKNVPYTQEKHQGIRPTGHKTYFMNLP
jgi:hypothetical protein